MIGDIFVGRFPRERRVALIGGKDDLDRFPLARRQRNEMCATAKLAHLSEQRVRKRWASQPPDQFSKARKLRCAGGGLSDDLNVHGGSCPVFS
jgi:hypothetical protein